jgi:hypothetical protein
MAIIKVITPSVTDANITTAKVTDNAITLAKMASGTDGNIISYDASGNPVAIATGSDGQVLTSTGAGSPPAFEAAAAGGLLLQVATNIYRVRFVTSSTSFVAATNYTVTLTPSATTSRIFLISSGAVDTEGNGRICYGTFYRTISGGSATHIGGDAEGIAQAMGTDSRVSAPMTLSMLDSPSTTSAVTYQVYIRTQSGHSGNVSYNNNEGAAHFTAFEIAGT